MNAVADVVSKTPMPAMAAADTKNRPRALPSEQISARRGPMAIALDTARRTAGPGVKVTSSATLQKTSQFESSIFVRHEVSEAFSINPEKQQTTLRWLIRAAGIQGLCRIFPAGCACEWMTGVLRNQVRSSSRINSFIDTLPPLRMFDEPAEQTEYR